jgi:zinc/manganese transport system substrate-binding protein
VIAGATPRILVVLGVAAGALAGCGSSQPPAIPGVVRVVAGENFWGNIAAQIGGRYVRVTSILTSPTADPHLYESDVASAVAVAEAGLVIQNGAGYDVFLSQLLGATRHPGRVVVCVQDVLGATGPDVNPHFWYDIPRVPEVARAIEAALARLEPRDAGAFAAGLAAFDASLHSIEGVIREIRRRYPGAPVAYTERVPGYLLAAAGLTVLTIGFLLQQPFAQHALLAAALVAVSCGLIGPFVVTRGMAFAVHGTAELAFTGAAAGLLIDNDPVVGARRR